MMARPRKQGERKPNGKLKKPVTDERLTAAKYRIRDFGVSLLTPMLSAKYRRLIPWMGPEQMEILRALVDNRLVAPLPAVRETLEAAAECTEAGWRRG
jgi:hypothetical protein